MILLLLLLSIVLVYAVTVTIYLFNAHNTITNLREKVEAMENAWIDDAVRRNR